MATQAYVTWNNRGRPWELAYVIEQLVNRGRAVGVTVLGTIGNDAHLMSNNPQDHAPFSFTAWPVALPGYVVTAADLKEGLFADTFLAETKQGLHQWVKYINLRGRHYDFRSGNWANPVVTSSGDIHLHVSARTDRLNWAYTTELEKPDMTREETERLYGNAWRTATIIDDLPRVPTNEETQEFGVANQENKVHTRLNAIEASLARIEAKLAS